MDELERRALEWLHSLGTFAGFVRTVVVLCAFATLTAVLVNFLLAQRSSAVRREKRSIVATGTMLGFFVAFAGLIRFHIGAVEVLSPAAWRVAATAGLALMVAGATLNILGRLALGPNWGDHIRIYRNHGLVTRGAYRLVRHPLYASLIWMACGASIVFENPLALLAALGVFLPAMAYRARQEETALTAEFDAYAEYRRRTGMFFPRLPTSWNRK